MRSFRSDPLWLLVGPGQHRCGRSVATTLTCSRRSSSVSSSGRRWPRLEPYKKGRLIKQIYLIPWPKLGPARKPDDTPIKQLARSIDLVGLLQNLPVTADGEGNHYDVGAGKRRLAAL